MKNSMYFPDMTTTERIEQKLRDAKHTQQVRECLDCEPADSSTRETPKLRRKALSAIFNR